MTTPQFIVFFFTSLLYACVYVAPWSCEARRFVPLYVRGHSPGGESGRGAPVPTKCRHLGGSAHETPPLGRNRPRLPSKACKLTATLVAKAYSAAGQAASVLYAMAILQVHQAKALKQVHMGNTDPGLMQELRTVTDFALRATKVTAWSLGTAMSTMVVQERHLWLNLAEMKDVDKARFLDAPISLYLLAIVWLFPGCSTTPSRALPSSSRRYSSRPRRSSTSCPGMIHRPPLPLGTGLSLPVAMGALLFPPELLRPMLNRHLGRRVEPLEGEWHPLCPSQAPSCLVSRRSSPDAGNPEMLEFALSQEAARTALLLPPKEGREENPMLNFISDLPLVQGPAVPTLLKKERFAFPPGFSGAWDDSVRCPASSLSPTTHLASSQECGSGMQYLG